MTDERAGAPAWFLVGSGLLTMLYSVVYLAWTLLGTLWPLLGSIGSVMDGSNSPGEALMALLLLIAVPGLQLVGFAATLLMGAVTAFGGFRLDGYRSRGLVWLAILASTGAPLLALLVNAGSALNLGACGLGCLTGCLLGNIPTVFLLLIGVIASGFAAYHVSQPEAAARFAR